MSVTIGKRANISDQVRQALETIGDHLIPEAHDMPAASAMGVGGGQLDLVLRSRPDLAPILEETLAATDLSDIEAFVTRLREDNPAAYDAVTLAIVAGYYMHPEIHERIGYPGQVAKDVQRMSEREIYLEGLMELAQKVVDRGPIYRPTPTTTESE